MHHQHYTPTRTRHQFTLRRDGETRDDSRCVRMVHAGSPMPRSQITSVRSIARSRVTACPGHLAKNTPFFLIETSSGHFHCRKDKIICSSLDVLIDFSLSHRERQSIFYLKEYLKERISFCIALFQVWAIFHRKIDFLSNFFNATSF